MSLFLFHSDKCIFCGEPARMRCDVCQSRFMSEERDNSVYLCSTCDKRAHKSPETQRHARDKECSPSYLKLLSVICIETSHYVCFTRADDEWWIFLDSMAYRVCESLVNMKLNSLYHHCHSSDPLLTSPCSLQMTSTTYRGEWTALVCSMSGCTLKTRADCSPLLHEKCPSL